MSDYEKEVKEMKSSLGQLLCDVDTCAHKLSVGKVEWSEELIGYNCPKCGSNMLTKEDFENAEVFLKLVEVGIDMGLMKSEPSDGTAGQVKVKFLNGGFNVDFTPTESDDKND